MTKRAFFLLTFLVAVGCQRQSPAQTGSSMGDAGSETVSSESETAAIAPEDEPGERLEFHGRVLDSRGEPVGRTSILAWQTDITGQYNRPEDRTTEPRLQARIVTSEDGRFHFSTIRPGAYPGGGNPQHIHLTIQAPGRDVHYTTFWFDDDPIITSELRSNLDEETVIVSLSREPGGTLLFSHDIRLPGN